MGSTVRSLTQYLEPESSAIVTIRWRNWPLVDSPRWSWILPAGVLSVGVLVAWIGDGWLLPALAVAALAVAFWQFLLPVNHEICSLGVRRYALGRMRLIPWNAIRAYQLRTTGVLFFQRDSPTPVDLLSSLFVPYPADEDEVVVAVRLYLAHAMQLP
jgi:hypothetical protein